MVVVRWGEVKSVCDFVLEVIWKLFLGDWLRFRMYSVWVISVGFLKEKILIFFLVFSLLKCNLLWKNCIVLLLLYWNVLFFLVMLVRFDEVL